MKKFYSIFLLGFILLAGNSFAYDEGAKTHNIEDSTGPQDVPVRVYQLVRFPFSGVGNIGVAVSAGDVLMWDTISDDGITVNILSELSATSLDAVAGVAVGAIPTADVVGNTASLDTGRRNWGYVQTYGLNETVNQDGTLVVGRAIGATLNRKCGNLADTGAGRTQRSLGFALDTQATSGNGNADVFIAVR